MKPPFFPPPKRAAPQDSPKFYLFKAGTHTVPTTTRVLTPGTTLHAPVAGFWV